MFLQKAFFKLPWEKLVSPDVSEKFSFVCKLLNFSSLDYSGLLILSGVYYNYSSVGQCVSNVSVCQNHWVGVTHKTHTHTNHWVGGLGREMNKIPGV